jgi:hypothetical protein
MGLDMYLNKKVYVGAEYEHRNVTGVISIFSNGEQIPVNFGNVLSIEERAGYWRKANAIHQWFVDNVQDGKDECQESYLPIKDAQRLLDTVNAVLEDHDKAAELLPTQNGFFFGGTEYNEYYFDDLRHTKEIMESVVADADGEYYYQSSW